MKSILIADVDSKKYFINFNNFNNYCCHQKFFELTTACYSSSTTDRSTFILVILALLVTLNKAFSLRLDDAVFFLTNGRTEKPILGVGLS